MEKGAVKKTPKKKSSSDKDTSSEDDNSVLRGPLILGKIITNSIEKRCEVLNNNRVTLHKLSRGKVVIKWHT